MQDLHSITVNGRLFGDRRLRHQNNNNNNNNNNQTTKLKCPRCESSNTKFCYYNNYNLSQPRHFCKNCRRYWTNGGVLRNVPVGGGCRKSNTKYSQQQQQQRKATKPPNKKHSSPLSNYSNDTISGPSQLGNFMDGTNNNGNGLEGDDNNTVVSFSEFIMGSGDLTVRIEDLIDHPTVENTNSCMRRSLSNYSVENEGQVQVQGLFDFSTSTSSASVVDDHHAFWTSTQQDLSHWGLNHTITNDLPLFLP